MTTTTPYATTTLQPVEGRVLFGGTSNPYYRTPQQRQLTARVYSNDRGEHFAALLVGREYQPGQHVWDRHEWHSPLFDGPDKALGWAADTLEWAAGHYTGQHRPDDPLPPAATPAWPLWKSHTVCQQCGAFDTITLRFAEWHDVHTCSACGDQQWFPIGD